MTDGSNSYLMSHFPFEQTPQFSTFGGREGDPSPLKGKGRCLITNQRKGLTTCWVFDMEDNRDKSLSTHVWTLRVGKLGQGKDSARRLVSVKVSTQESRMPARRNMAPYPVLPHVPKECSDRNQGHTGSKDVKAKA